MQTNPPGLITTYTKLSPSFYRLLYSLFTTRSETSNIKPPFCHSKYPTLTKLTNRHLNWGKKVVVSAKSHTKDAYSLTPFPPNPNSRESTISTVEREIREAGGESTAIQADTTDTSSIDRLVAETIRVRIN